MGLFYLCLFITWNLEAIDIFSKQKILKREYVHGQDIQILSYETKDKVEEEKIWACEEIYEKEWKEKDTYQTLDFFFSYFWNPKVGVSSFFLFLIIFLPLRHLFIFSFHCHTVLSRVPTYERKVPGELWLFLQKWYNLGIKTVWDNEKISRAQRKNHN